MHTYGSPLFNPWSWPASGDEAARRAGGRRHYNSLRHLRAAVRRLEMTRFLLARGLDYGSQQRAAEALGVSAATISRDVTVLRSWMACQGCSIWPADLRMPKRVTRLIEHTCRR